MTNKTFIHTDAIAQLSDTWHPFFGMRKTSRVVCSKTKWGKKEFYDNIVLPKKAFLELTNRA